MARKPQKTFAGLPEKGSHPVLSGKDYKQALTPLQYLMRSISLSYFRQRLNAVVVIEGSDAAGKGGAIRRMTAELDPRHYDVWPIGPPSVEELRHHYLWRFWQRMPESGLIGIFDRSWYGRVLVERVDALTPESRWRDAYDEIRDFEESLIRDGTRLVKIYLHVSTEEQRRRLAQRVTTPHKNWKVSAADFRNYLQRDAYLAAASEMLEKCSGGAAPWHVIAADDKKHTRIAVLETVTKALSRDVDLTPRPLDDETLRLAREVLGDRVD
jgi:AMP-polyphosphate phosphotransferase